ELVVPWSRARMYFTRQILLGIRLAPDEPATKTRRLGEPFSIARACCGALRVLAADVGLFHAVPAGGRARLRARRGLARPAHGNRRPRGAAAAPQPRRALVLALARQGNPEVGLAGRAHYRAPAPADQPGPRALQALPEEHRGPRHACELHYAHPGHGDRGGGPRRVPGACDHAGERRGACGKRNGPAREPLRGAALMFAVVTVALLVALVLLLARAVLGPTVFDRLLAANTIGTVAVLLLSVIGFLAGRPEFLDLAIVYGLLNIVGTIAVLKFFERGSLGE